MKSFIYFIKMLILTSAVVLVLQIKIGKTTAEEKISFWLRTSNVVQPLRQSAHGALVAVKNVFYKISNQVETGVGEKFDSKIIPGKRQIVEIKRSASYIGEVKERERQREKAQKSARKSHGDPHRQESHEGY